MKRHWITLLFALGRTGLVAACGGESDDDDDNGEDTSQLQAPADEINFV